MRKPLRSILAALAALFLLQPAGAAEVWDAPAFSVPAAQLLQAAKAIKRERVTNVVILLEERSFVLDDQHRVTRTSRLIYRVDTPDGVEGWASSFARWQPWHQAKPTIRARVISPDGTEHQIDQSLLVDAGTRDGSDRVFDDTHTIRGPLPAVAIGAIVEEEITVRDEKPFFAAGTANRESIGRNMPVLRTRVTIDAPESLPLKHLTQLLPDAQVQKSSSSGRTRWSLEQGELDEWDDSESHLPPDEPARPNFQFSTGVSWEAVATTYRELTEPRIRNDDAKPLLAGLKAPLANSPTREYITSLVERLHREVRYTGVEFGDARLIPAFPVETLRRKFGDCKDKSTLLVAALRASGIDAYLALLSADGGQDVSPDLPGLGMFDHAIVYVPGTPDLWIDATAEYTRVGTLPASATNRLALVIRSGEEKLTRTPVMRSADNREVQTREFHLVEYGPARAIETTEVFGTIEGAFRSWYAGADTKQRRDDLNSYAKGAYRAKSLTNYSHTNSNDFSTPYSLRLEIEDAEVASTDLSSAAVRVRVSNITSRLPNYFGTLLKEDRDDSDAEPRTTDVVFDPFVVEWQYRIHPPPGFQARKLPANAMQELGPSQLKSEFKLTADGSVHATWRFDTVKGRYTPAESEALAKALRELKRKETTHIAFDHIGVALSNEGDFKGALQANEALAAKFPRKAVHRLRTAAALNNAGLSARAQREALAATKLEPKSALAWQTLGGMLQQDAVGRRFGAGYDRAGAIAAYRKARTLDPEDTDIAVNLAALLEHDANGQRYSPGSNLDEALKVYQERRALLSEADLKSDSYRRNMEYVMLYSRRFSELREFLREQTQNSSTRALMLAATAAELGSGPALELARSLVGDEKERFAALTSAGNLLFRLREYPAAADLLEAGSRGESNTAATAQRIALLRKTRRDDGKSAKLTEPSGVTLRWLAELMSNWAAKDTGLADKLLAPGSESLLDGTDFTLARRTMIGALTKQDISLQVAADLMFSNVRVNVEGDDAQGHRVQLRTPGTTQTFYVVKLADSYRILAIAPSLGPLATRALQRIDAGDLAGARQWLDWARAEVKPASVDDPAAGPYFPRSWTVGAEPDLVGARVAGALLLADNDKSEPAIKQLLAARAATTSAADQLNIDLALASVHRELQQWTPLLEVATRLVAALPTSAFAFEHQQIAYIHLDQWEVAEASARARLARLPDDASARQMLVYGAEEHGKLDEARAVLQPVLDSGRATAQEYNQYAWTSLLRRPVDERAVEAARAAYDESQGRSYSINHTLACIYAATGKPREARDLLIKGMEQNFMIAPEDSTWFGFGLIAEAYGDTASARDYYARVEKPKKGPISASGVYAMSQVRLGALSPGKN